MRKFTSFLALLVIAFALPDKVKAWDYSGGSDPWKIVLRLDNNGQSETEMTFDWDEHVWRSGIFIAKFSELKFQTDLYNGNQDSYGCYTIGNSDYPVYADGADKAVKDFNGGDNW